MKRDNVGTIRRKLKIYRGLFIATSVALLAFPVAVNGDFVKERYQILINGRSVGTAESKEAAQAAYEQSCKKKTFGEHMDEFFAWVGDIIKKGCEKNFIIERKDERFMRMPIIVFILLLIFAFWISVPLLIIGLFCDCRYHFEGDAKAVQDINNACDKASDACANVKEDIKK